MNNELTIYMGNSFMVKGRWECNVFTEDPRSYLPGIRDLCTVQVEVPHEVLGKIMELPKVKAKQI